MNPASLTETDLVTWQSSHHGPNKAHPDVTTSFTVTQRTERSISMKLPQLSILTVFLIDRKVTFPVCHLLLGRIKPYVALDPEIN